MLAVFCLLTQAKQYGIIHHPKQASNQHPYLVTGGNTPFILHDRRVGNLERDYSTTDLNSIVDQVSNEFGLERDRVQNYFSRSKWASYAKQLFNRLDFSFDTNGYKVITLGGTVIKITKSNGVYNVNCRKADVTSKLLRADCQLRMQHLDWRFEYCLARVNVPLNGQEIAQVYEKLNHEIEGTLNAYKNI
ncbi:hypothetical protein TVAG_321190 [Trichomonas vaginalis G3]|uniref:Uncharacterized protein n=1 Tax=Trichomonas vaginalis (strain ATCC PRA-98 / G3) TaxID=412133 RepID=A2F825_TRIV3|nr:hypothetical protein TVAGG3_0383600 [Trichomonas vaginalis G3]XP_001311889.1 hypothetical protein TVAGG3_0383570 [Trichomonas vaginalis G3]EAX98957.1 hypothetical protein TVAG_321170 [Trichomonas vaginalis G3]EAX98959.1 hypothetical protein TVAG_321190 [Trichomonas vaginalis G3]KAI5533460.1 hypothetical protein TVAGG3_0383570 [Trichomonas vaginalis G3]KAI5533462.1 hypothetical protein TVAGG3_0383600 [Trichomonas vaginalis G3]|eukprot:XP_001311887.1 hypothetical protein [Trichomonas vaginalis G3]